MKKLFMILFVSLILVGCSAKSNDTVCTTTDFEGGKGTITLVRESKDNDKLKAISIEGDVSDPEAAMGVAMINAFFTNVGGINFEVKNDKLSAMIEFDKLDTEALATLIGAFASEMGEVGEMPSAGEIDIMIAMLRSHDLIVSQLEDSDFTCK